MSCKAIGFALLITVSFEPPEKGGDQAAARKREGSAPNNARVPNCVRGRLFRAGIAPAIVMRLMAA